MRRRYTTAQKIELMKAFERDPYFGVQTAKNVTAATGITRKAASSWFRRMRAKKAKNVEETMQSGCQLVIMTMSTYSYLYSNTCMCET